MLTKVQRVLERTTHSAQRTKRTPHARARWHSRKRPARPHANGDVCLLCPRPLCSEAWAVAVALHELFSIAIAAAVRRIRVRALPPPVLETHQLRTRHTHTQGRCLVNTVVPRESTLARTELQVCIITARPARAQERAAKQPSSLAAKQPGSRADHMRCHATEQTTACCTA